MSDLGFEDALDKILNEYISSINVSIPCIVDSYINGSVTVTPAVKRTFKDGSSLAMPSIPLVPICYPSGGGYSMTFPISKGDEGLLVISHRDISAFKLSGGIEEPPSYRKHSLADAVFLPCKLSNQQDYIGTGLVLSDGVSNITIDASGISINGTLTINGVPYLLHTHSAVQAGNDISGPVVGL